MIDHDHYMTIALDQAHKATTTGEVPIGAVIVCEHQIIAATHNQPIALDCCTAHAEILALEAACRQQQNYRLQGCTLYVTLEPCMMCLGAMIHARIDHLVYGASDPKTGALGGAEALHTLSMHNHQFTVTSGVLATECGDVLKQFFKDRR